MSPAEVMVLHDLNEETDQCQECGAWWPCEAWLHAHGQENGPNNSLLGGIA